MLFPYRYFTCISPLRELILPIVLQLLVEYNVLPYQLMGFVTKSQLCHRFVVFTVPVVRHRADIGVQFARVPIIPFVPYIILFP